MNLALWDSVAQKSALQVIEQYSTSFTLASRLLAPRIRADISTLYAVVRIADEIVDGVASEAGEDPARILDQYEKQIRNAHLFRFHTDPVVHAFADLARRCNLQDEYLAAFFNSMRQDLNPDTHSAETLTEYIHGSAEVIGQMCVDIFYAESEKPEDFAEIETSAKALGAGFQKVNFLRDVAADSRLGRQYLPNMDDKRKAELIAEIQHDFLIARRVIPRLPDGCRAAVAAALAIYEELTMLIDACPSSTLATTRFSVPNHRKIRLVAQAVWENRKKVEK